MNKIETVKKTEFPDLKLIRRGKVRDVYDLGEVLLIVATDRISAFDVIMNDAIPYKGNILSAISTFWFDKTRDIINNHLISADVSDFPHSCSKYKELLADRSMIVRKAQPLPVEFVVRGFIAGSGWKEYKKSRSVCDVELPDGLVEFGKLPEPIFTPTTKEDVGHDMNINFDKTSEIIGKDLAEKLRQKSIDLYNFASDYLDKRNIILADTKFEFGIDKNGEPMLIDEALTPDSSRFWLKESYAAGRDQTNFDKQILRDFLESIAWNKQPPPPKLPSEIIIKTMEKYIFAYDLIVDNGKLNFKV